jgi:hypothetical protein
MFLDITTMEVAKLRPYIKGMLFASSRESNINILSTGNRNVKNMYLLFFNFSNLTIAAFSGKSFTTPALPRTELLSSNLECAISYQNNFIIELMGLDRFCVVNLMLFDGVYFLFSLLETLPWLTWVARFGLSFI